MIVEAVKAGADKFRTFQTHRREAELKRRSIPTSENWFWLMDQINPAKKDEQIDYVIQNSSYAVSVSSVSGYLESGSFLEIKDIKVTQPIGIDHHEIDTRFFLPSFNGQEPQCIGFQTGIFDTSTHPDKIISDKDEKTQVVSFGIRGHIKKSPHRLGDEGCCLPSPKEEEKVDLSNLYLSSIELAEVINNAYRIAFSAITRKIVPESAQPASPSLLQRPFKLQLI